MIGSLLRTSLGPFTRPPRAGLAATLLGAALAASAAAGVGCCGSEAEGGIGSECMQGKAEAFEEGGPFDPEGGRDHRHYPPDRRVDHLHMTLAMRFEDLSRRRFEAVQELRLRALGLPVAMIELDAVDLRIHSVQRDGSPAEHYSDGLRLSIALEPILAPGEEVTLRIEYACEAPTAGMTFSPDYPDDPARGWEVHTQGQPQTNRHWFPCHDFPNERLSTELIVDVPAGYSASSNGALVRHEERDGRAIWHWKQERPHVNYLVSLVIGTFSQVEIPAASNGVPMRVWCPPGSEELARATYARTGAMMDLFERRFGTPYPWARYDQLVVRNFGAGGMENTAATTMHPQALYDAIALADGDLDGLISHELAHQWFGNLITCRSWAHLWLNEGWATYSTALWYEQRDGRDGYLDSIRGAFGVARRDRPENPQPMVSNDYATPGETFRRAANPYTKGSSILHMLRTMLGEDAFWSGVRDYVATHADGVVETDDFRHAMERASGLELEWFFAQWCARPGAPQLVASVEYDAARREVVVEVSQTQQIDARTPAFRFDLPIAVVGAAGTEVFTLPMRDRSAAVRFPVAGVPTMIVVDPELSVLRTLELRAPLPLLLAQAEHGPTIAARRDAIEAIRSLGAGRGAGRDGAVTIDRSDVIETLERIARDGARRASERGDAISALAAIASPESTVALAALLDARAAALACPRTRVAAVRAARELPPRAAIEVLAAVAAEDPSYACREAAIEGLARMRATEHVDLIAGLLAVPSHADRVRLAAIDALATLEDTRAFEAALAAARLGNCDRVRPRAIALLGRAAGENRTAAIEFLLATLDDPERRSVQAAGEALASLRAEEARPRIERLAQNGPPWLRTSAERWLRRLEEG
ncbi:MAG TPA: M1 family aminopeptidase [Phycisphaerales bacterium]|nr:M1 family aminopeptidase [Phycisphaerales bacterium]HMP37721.1 M1 family aminopeptidase [Phycisphaerales bacterium]